MRYDLDDRYAFNSRLRLFDDSAFNISSIFICIFTSFFSFHSRVHLVIDCTRWTNGDAVSSNRSHVKRLKDSYFKYETDRFWFFDFLPRITMLSFIACVRDIRNVRESSRKFWSVRAGHPVHRVHQLFDHTVCKAA